MQCSDTLKRKLDGRKGSVDLSTRGRKFNVEVPTKKQSKASFGSKPIPASEVKRFKIAVGLNKNQGEKAMSIIRNWKGRNTFESNTREKIIYEEQVLEPFFFTSKEIIFHNQAKTIIYCHDFHGLLSKVKEERKLGDNFFLKIGIDVGGWLSKGLSEYYE